MAKPQQTATELGRTLAGKWTKSEKREAASRSIMFYKQLAHDRVKAVKQGIYLSK